MQSDVRLDCQRIVRGLPCCSTTDPDAPVETVRGRVTGAGGRQIHHRVETAVHDAELGFTETD